MIGMAEKRYMGHTYMRPSSEHETIREPSLLKCTAVT
jgi:hypothetical protein